MESYQLPHHPYMRPPPPPPPQKAADPHYQHHHHHHQLPPPPPNNSWFPNQFQYSPSPPPPPPPPQQQQNQWGPPPPPPPPYHLPHQAAAAAYPPQPYTQHPLPRPYSHQDWPNANWSHYHNSVWEYPPIQQASFPTPGFQNYQGPVTPMSRPPMVHQQEPASISSYGADTHFSYAAKDRAFGGDVNAAFPHHQGSTNSLVHQQEVPSSYSSVPGKEDGSQVQQYGPSLLPSDGRSVSMNHAHFAYGNHLPDPMDQPLEFAQRFGHENDPQMKSGCPDISGPVRGMDSVSAVPSLHAWTTQVPPGESYRPMAPAYPSAPQHDASVGLPPLPGQPVPMYGRGPSFPPGVPSTTTPVALGMGSSLHHTAAFPTDAYGPSLCSERPKKWLREEIVKNKATITTAPEPLKEGSQSNEEEIMGKSTVKGDQADSKSMDSAKSTEEEDDNDEMAELSEDALIEILARLPVKSLIRFTSVCKLWRSLIKSPEFASKHYAARLSLKEDHNDYDCFLTSFFPACSISIFCYKSMAFETAFKIRPALAADEPPRFGISHRDIITNCFISGPCNGLFLLRLFKGLYSTIIVLLLWNPATREVFKIPLPDEKFCYVCTEVGFGFDHVANDLKVVFFNGFDANSSLVNLYSLATNHWRQVDAGLYIDIKKKIISHRTSFLNGAKTHFLSSESESMKLGLASFDMVDEVFVETALPHDLASGKIYFGGFWPQISNREVYPTVYGTNTINFDNRTTELHIWVLKEGYGPAGVWNKQQSIVVSPFVGYSQIILWYDTDIVAPNGIDGISVHNLTTRERKTLHIPGDGQHLIPYVESMISITGFIRQSPSVVEDQSSVEVGIRPRQGYQDDGHSFDPVELQSLLDRFPEIQERIKEDDHDSDSSTDSAFLMPRGSYFLECGAYYIYRNHDAERLFYPYRKNECERLCRLPYCLREVNQPLVSRPCTF